MTQTVKAVSHDLSALAAVCTKMGSPFFGGILERAAAAFAADPVLRELLERHAHRSRIGLRLGGAAHFRALRGLAPQIAAHYPSTGGDGNVDAAWRAVLDDVHADTPAYDALFERHVQTNEVARSMPVLAAMLAVADAVDLPLCVYEIGSSAGLVLNFDRYYYSGEGWVWGDPGSPLHLANRTASGRPAHVNARLRIRERFGCDLHPLDASNDADADTLLGFVWPDQQERFDRLRAAIAVARAYPLPITRGDGIAWARTSALPREGCAAVLLHTVMTEHLSVEQRSALAGTVCELATGATRSAPFAWVRMEPGTSGYDTLLTRWPGEIRTQIAASDGHAQNIRWCGA